MRLAEAVLCAVMLASCTQVRDVFAPSAPDMSPEWSALLEEVRVFERRIGFRDTKNFLDLSEDRDGFRFCGYASPFHLPYSYEDPAIHWIESVTEQECRALAGANDVYYGTVQAWGEAETPVTPSMVKGKLDNFLYLVLHEDCHDQFELPYGIEEALCNLITYKAMTAFAAQKFGPDARETKAIRRYAGLQSKITRATIRCYETLAALYARFQRGEISSDRLLIERSAIYAKAGRELNWAEDERNNIMLANDMTYSRHYPPLERAYEVLGNDLSRAVSFFGEVDARKPDRDAVMTAHRIATEESVEFVRAYEAAIIDAIEKLLATTPKTAS